MQRPKLTGKRTKNNSKLPNNIDTDYHSPIYPIINDHNDTSGVIVSSSTENFLDEARNDLDLLSLMEPTNVLYELKKQQFLLGSNSNIFQKDKPDDPLMGLRIDFFGVRIFGTHYPSPNVGFTSLSNSLLKNIKEKQGTDINLNALLYQTALPQIFNNHQTFYIEIFVKSGSDEPIQIYNLKTFCQSIENFCKNMGLIYNNKILDTSNDLFVRLVSHKCILICVKNNQYAPPNQTNNKQKKDNIVTQNQPDNLDALPVTLQQALLQQIELSNQLGYTLYHQITNKYQLTNSCVKHIPTLPADHLNNLEHMNTQATITTDKILNTEQTELFKQQLLPKNLKRKHAEISSGEQDAIDDHNMSNVEKFKQRYPLQKTPETNSITISNKRRKIAIAEKKSPYTTPSKIVTTLQQTGQIVHNLSKNLFNIFHRDTEDQEITYDIDDPSYRMMCMQAHIESSLKIKQSYIESNVDIIVSILENIVEIVVDKFQLYEVEDVYKFNQNNNLAKILMTKYAIMGYCKKILQLYRRNRGLLFDYDYLKEQMDTLIESVEYDIHNQPDDAFHHQSSRRFKLLNPKTNACDDLQQPISDISYNMWSKNSSTDFLISTLQTYHPNDRQNKTIYYQLCLVLSVLFYYHMIVETNEADNFRSYTIHNHIIDGQSFCQLQILLGEFKDASSNNQTLSMNNINTNTQPLNIRVSRLSKFISVIQDYVGTVALDQYISTRENKRFICLKINIKTFNNLTEQALLRLTSTELPIIMKDKAKYINSLPV